MADPRSTNKLGLSGADERDTRAAEQREVTQDRVMSDDAAFTLFKQAHDQGKLPNLPLKDGYHRCWVSTMHLEDTIPLRQSFGYRFVRPADIPGFDARHYPAAGNTAGQADRVQVQEMVAMEIPTSLYARMMQHNHHDEPARNEEVIAARYDQLHQAQPKPPPREIVESDGLIRMRQTQAAPDFAAEEARRTA